MLRNLEILKHRESSIGVVYVNNLTDVKFALVEYIASGKCYVHSNFYVSQTSQFHFKVTGEILSLLVILRRSQLMISI